jgi:hypothetical protein
MTTTKWSIDTAEQQQDLRYLAARFDEKGCLPVWGGDDARNPLIRERDSRIVTIKGQILGIGTSCRLSNFSCLVGSCEEEPEGFFLTSILAQFLQLCRRDLPAIKASLVEDIT